MNVTFFIGNGFDISLGMQTSYSNFLKWYLEQDSDDIDINIFKNEIEKDFNSDQSEKLWSDVEEGLAAITEKFQSIETYMKCYEDLHEKLIEYLSKEERKYRGNDAILEKVTEIIRKQLANYYEGLTSVEKSRIARREKIDSDQSEIINFICFNYTMLLDDIYNRLAKSEIKTWIGTDKRKHSMVVGDICHIHGYLNQFPILGVCQNEDIKNQDFLSDSSFRETLIKAESNNFIGEMWREKTKSIIEKSNIICIFGMSLGKTDSDYWEMILSWLKQNNDRRVVIFWYSDIGKNNTSIYDKAVRSSKIINAFLNYAPLTDQEKHTLFNRIYIKIDPNPLFQIPEDLKINNVFQQKLIEQLLVK